MGTEKEGTEKKSTKKKDKKRRDSLFSQQKLPTWQPIINVGTTWFIFIGLGILLTSLGIAQVVILGQMSDDIEVKYSDDAAHPEMIECVKGLADAIKKAGGDLSCSTCQCKLEFEVKEEQKLKVPVFLYYKMTDFYQNHRLYVSSRDDKQLIGRIFDEKTDKENKGYPPEEEKCSKPFWKDEKTKKHYYPCGAAANSMFSDRFDNLEHEKDEEKSPIKLITESGIITWPIELDYKYKKPPGITDKDKGNAKKVTFFTKHYVKPRDWSEHVWDDWWANGGVENPHFANWMHQAPMKDFRKLYAVIKEGCKDDPQYLCAGKYSLDVDYRYQPPGWDGKKTLIFSTTSVFGTRKPFMAWFTLVLGIFSIVVGIVFLILKKTLKVKVHPHTRRSMEQEDLATTTEADPNPTDDETIQETRPRNSKNKTIRTSNDSIPDDLNNPVKRRKSSGSKKRRSKTSTKSHPHHHHKKHSGDDPENSKHHKLKHHKKKSATDSTPTPKTPKRKSKSKTGPK